MIKIITNVHRFMIYREGSSVNWDCSLTDLSRATGIDLRIVSKICKSEDWLRRGWHPKLNGTNEISERAGAQNAGVDHIMQMAEGSHIRARYDY